jgi:mRNA interferase RelE/StbE
MAGYRPDIPPGVAEVIRTLPPDVKRAVKAALRALAAEPAAGAPLRGELEGLMKYRVRRYRIVYQVVRAQRMLRILAVGHRRAVYEALAEALRRGSG